MTLMAERAFPALTRYIADINIIQAGFNADVTSPQQGFERGRRLIQQLISRMKPADMPWGFRAQLIG